MSFNSPSFRYMPFSNARVIKKFPYLKAAIASAHPRNIISTSMFLIDVILERDGPPLL